MFNIVLVEPEIPQNTGTIGRLCVCTDSRLHLIRPLGFSLDESRIRRAGLDYWQYLEIYVHENWEDYLHKACPERFIFLSTKSAQSIYAFEFREDDHLIFGNESRGLPSNFYQEYSDRLYTIPMPGVHSRSHNLANAVSITLYEGLRQVALG